MSEDKVRAITNFVCQHPGEDPVEAARKRLSEIDNELGECNDKIVTLRKERTVCNDVLSRFGERSKKATRTPAPAIDLDDDSETNVDTRCKIVALLDGAERVTKQEIVQGAGGYDNDTRINRMLKWLGERGIIANADGAWARGPKWAEKDDIIGGKTDGEASSG